MAIKNDHYTYRVTWSADDNEYVGLCAEFPSLSWLAETPELAVNILTLRARIFTLPYNTDNNSHSQLALYGLNNGK